MKKEKIYSPAELLELYPGVEKLGWTAAAIGSLFRMGLLVGYFRGKENKAFIYEESFVSLMRYLSKVNRDRDVIDFQ